MLFNGFSLFKPEDLSHLDSFHIVIGHFNLSSRNDIRIYFYNIQWLIYDLIFLSLLIIYMLLIKFLDGHSTKSDKSKKRFVVLDDYFLDFKFYDFKPVVVVTNVWHDNCDHENVLENLVVHVIVVLASDVKHTVINEDRVGH